MVNTKVFSYIFLILCCVFIIGVILNLRFFTLLRKKDPEKWKELGGPIFSINNSIKSTLTLFTFLKNKEYFKLNDSKLTKISRLLWNFIIFYIIFFAGVLVIFIINLRK